MTLLPLSHNSVAVSNNDDDDDNNIIIIIIIIIINSDKNSGTLREHLQGDQKVSVHLMITVQNIFLASLPGLI
jgi:hypothetical protein